MSRFELLVEAYGKAFRRPPLEARKLAEEALASMPVDVQQQCLKRLNCHEVAKWRKFYAKACGLGAFLKGPNPDRITGFDILTKVHQERLGGSISEIRKYWLNAMPDFGPEMIAMCAEVMTPETARDTRAAFEALHDKIGGMTPEQRKAHQDHCFQRMQENRKQAEGN